MYTLSLTTPCVSTTHVQRPAHGLNALAVREYSHRTKEKFNDNDDLSSRKEGQSLHMEHLGVVFCPVKVATQF